MKQQRAACWLLFGLTLALCQCAAAYALVPVAPAGAKEMRKAHRGTLGHACRTPPKTTPRKGHRTKPQCNTGLECTASKTCVAIGAPGSSCKTTKACSAASSLCFHGTCLDAVDRPKLAPCANDAMCSSGYCGTRARCASQHAEANKCTLNAQCTSLNCDVATGSCIATTAMNATTALSAVAPINNSKDFYNNNGAAASSTTASSRPLLTSSGQVKTLNNVAVVNSQAGSAIRLIATTQKPAAFQQTLDTSLQRRAATTTTTTMTNAVFAFHYLVVASTGKCTLVPYVNGLQRTPVIAIKAVNQAAAASFTYTGDAVTTYGVVLVCGGANANSTVDLDTVTIKSTSTSVSPSSTTSSTASVSASTAVSTTTASTTAPASVPTTPTTPVVLLPLPTGACSGLADCDFEATNPSAVSPFNVDVDVNGACKLHTYAANDGAALQAHSGLTSVNCHVDDGDYGFLPSSFDAFTYTVGSTYTWTFWVRANDSSVSFDALSCSVRGGDDGSGATAYDGACPLVRATTPVVNDYRMVAVSFVASDTNMQFAINIEGAAVHAAASSLTKRLILVPGGIPIGGAPVVPQDPTQYSFDDVSILEGAYTATYDTQATPQSTATTTTTTTISCDGFKNCGFESGHTNAWSRVLGNEATCSVTSDPSNVHSGAYAYRCRVNNPASDPNFFAAEGIPADAGIAQHFDISTLAPGGVYALSFWSKRGNSSSSDAGVTCSVQSSVARYYGQTVARDTGTAEDGNGFARYAGTFALDYDEQTDVNITCTGAHVGTTYYFDDFSLVQTAVSNVESVPVRCSGLGKCGFEQDGQSTTLYAYTPLINYGSSPTRCYLGGANVDTLPAHDGSAALFCNINDANTFVAVQGGTDHAYVAGTTYTLVFWVNTGGAAAAIASMRCVVWSKSGDGARAYDGACPVTQANNVNGYSQIAFTFTATASDMSLYVQATAMGAYAFDDVSILDGPRSFAYADGQSPDTPPANGGVQQTCNAGMHNCGLETGYANGYQINAVTEGQTCAVSSSNPHAGAYALRCTAPLTPPNYNGLQVILNDFDTTTLQLGVTYTFAFWANNVGDGSMIKVDVCRRHGINCYAIGAVPSIVAATLDSATGYQQYAVTFTVGSKGDVGYISLTFAPPNQDVTFYLDDFSIRPAGT